MSNADLIDVKRALAQSGFDGIRVHEMRGITALSMPLPAEDELIQRIVQSGHTTTEQALSE